MCVCVCVCVCVQDRAKDIEGFFFVESMISNQLENLSGGGIGGEINKVFLSVCLSYRPACLSVRLSDCLSVPVCFAFSPFVLHISIYAHL